MFLTIYESKNNDIAILRYPQDLENKEELPESFKVFNEKNEKELFGHDFRFSFGYSQKKDDILPKDKEKKPKSIFKRIFGI